jgi:hypothetical protein
MVKEAMADQLVRLGWRVGDDPPLAIDSRWSDIIGCILKYQQEHGGRTPFIPVIAMDTGMSPGQVQFHLEQMKKRGFIVEKGTWPLRLVVMATAVQAAEAEKQEQAPPVKKPLAAPKEAPPKEEEIMATVQVPAPARLPSGKKKRESFLVNAKRFAQALTDYYDEHGEAPLLKDIAHRLGYAGRHTAGLSRITNEMVQRGWLHHKDNCQRDWVLTGLGRAVLFGEPLRDHVHTDMPVRPQPTRVFEPAPQPEVKMEVRRADVPAKPVASRGWGEPERSPVMRVYAPKPEPERPAMREYEPVAKAVADLSDVDSVDLVLELTARGFRVSR